MIDNERLTISVKNLRSLSRLSFPITKPRFEVRCPNHNPLFFGEIGFLPVRGFKPQICSLELFCDSFILSFSVISRREVMFSSGKSVCLVIDF